MSNGYPRKFIMDVQKRQRKTDMIPEPEELVREFFASVDPPTRGELAIFGPRSEIKSGPCTSVQIYTV